MINTTHQSIADFTVNNSFDGYYILDSMAQRTTQAGKPYLSGVLSDASSRIPFVMWENLPALSDTDVGAIIYAEGEIQEYRNAPQVKINMLCLATDSDINNYKLSDLVPYAPIDLDKAFDEVLATLQDMKDEVYQAIALKNFMDYLLVLASLPAAKSIHHAFVGGWLMHTVGMMRLAEQVYQHNKDTTPIDHDLLIAGTFLHDIGKLREFTLNDNNLVKDYSMSGRLLGHPTLGVMMVEESVGPNFKTAHIEKVTLLEHIIAAHHGSPECGAAVYPQTVEAQIVHELDSMDSRIEIFREELKKTPIGQFSSFNRALNHSVYHHGNVA